MTRKNRVQVSTKDSRAQRQQRKWTNLVNYGKNHPESDVAALLRGEDRVYGSKR